MKNPIKKITAVLLTVLILYSVITALPFTAVAAETGSAAAGGNSGTTGDCTWSFDTKTKTLTISGNGKMADYNRGTMVVDIEEGPGEGYYYERYVYSTPWESLQPQKAIIKSGVENIGNAAFCGCTKLSSVEIPDSVTSIGKYAFTACIITDITIPNSVTEIADYAFSSYTTTYDDEWTTNFYTPKSCGLTSVTIPESVTSIGKGVFKDCVNLTSATVSNNKIGTAEFEGCRKLTNVTISDNVTEIGANAFSGCNTLTGIDIPGSVTSIGTRAFSNAWSFLGIGNGEANVQSYPACVGLTEIEIPDSVTNMGSYAFTGCTGLKSAVINNSEIGVHEFSNCSGLTDVEISDNVTGIGKCAFSGCTGLESITIPNSVTKIESYAFSGIEETYYYYMDEGKTVDYPACTGLTSVKIGSGLTSINSSVFNGCAALFKITVDGRNGTYDSRNDCNAIIKTETDELIYGCRSTVIPDSVTGIGNDAFDGCAGLTSITIPDSVTKIGDDAFCNCPNLKEVKITNINTAIGEHALGYRYDIVNEYDVLERKYQKAASVLTLYGKKDSTAQSYAKANNLNFTKLIIIGDLDGNGIVNGADAAIMSRYMSGWALYEKKIKDIDAADINKDGYVNGADSGILCRYVSGWKEYKIYF
ncbi:MAG: leucine-rich repeat protein [Ruminococcus sp.]|nr:leucine-rich repeat protein [Ruminococcus sp.]